jgi:L-rhamnose mutarotase
MNIHIPAGRTRCSSSSERLGEPITRRAFVHHVRPDRIDDYVAAHANVWPELLRALRDAGIRNYSIYRDGHRVFGYFEADDLDATAAFLSTHPVNVRWQHAMAGLLEQPVPHGGVPRLEEIFRLD